MDTAKITATKIAANPQDHSWAQAYSTLKLYIVLSVEDTSQKAVAATGKEILEKLQREFFALDDKSLEAIKIATTNVVKGLAPGPNVSIALATIVSGALYLVVVGSGLVIMHRARKSGIIAKGEGVIPVAFSGKLESGDNIALTTEEFIQKVPIGKIEEVFAEDDLQAATESIVPLVHSDSSGKEAAILLHYVNHAKIEQETLEKEDDQLEEKQDVIVGRTSVLSILPEIKLPNLKNFFTPEILHNRKRLIILATIILIIFFTGSLLFDKLNSQNKQRQEVFSQIMEPLQKKYNDAVSIASLNNTLALDELTQILDSIKAQRVKLPQESTEGKKLAEFEASVISKITELGGNPTGTQNLKVFFDSGKNQDIGTIVFITNKGGSFGAVGKNGKVGVLTDGKVSKIFDTKASGVKTITADETDLFILADGAYKISRNSGDASKIIDSSSGVLAIDTFGGNIYGLTSAGIDKYAGASYTKSNYLTGDAKINNPSSMSIDSSIWVIGKDGTIQKFTRGVADSFDIKNLSKPFGTSPKIYTDIDYANIYVLDPTNNRVVTISKSGDAGLEYKAREMARATSFAVNEPNKKLYILSSGKIYSQDL